MIFTIKMYFIKKKRQKKFECQRAKIKCVNK